MQPLRTQSSVKCVLLSSVTILIRFKNSKMKSLTINIPEEAEVQRVKMIIAASLFEQGVLSSGQAAELVGIPRKQFLLEVGSYGVSIFGETADDIEKLAGTEI